VTGLDGGVCFGGWVCIDESCQACTADTDCANGECNVDTGRCDPVGLCVLDSECPSNSYCDNEECVFAHPAQGICDLDKIYYSYDNSQVASLYAQRISNAASCIAAEVSGGASLELQVHTDIVGSSEYNLALAALRGNSVESYLGSLGVPLSGVSVFSYGSSQASGILEADRAPERRIDLVWQ
jgi:peptidoglycan-associated lipoprotein